MSAVCDLANERVLIEAAQQDPSRFAELYEKNFHRVYAFVSRRVGNREEAEDITAEVFHEALRSLGRFQWRGAPFSAWLLRIAANTLADRWQHAARTGSSVVQDFTDDNALSVQPDTERRAMLSQLVEMLPSDQRLVIVRRFIDQKPIREIAEELGRSEGAIKQLQFRALETLRSKVRSQHE